jgi:hypothetical protein
MTYSSRDKSVYLGKPFECYEFIGPVGTFRYTSLPFEVTLGGELYQPLVVTRTAIVIGSIIDSPQTMDFNLPASHTLCQAYAGRYTPDYLVVNAYRSHYGEDLSTEYTIEWQGGAVGYLVKDEWFTIQTVSLIQSKILGVTSTIYYQYGCNNRVYDSVCQAVKADHQVSTTVVRLDNVLVRVQAQTYANDELTLGTIKLDRTGEERSIVSNTDNVLTISYPFLDLVPGDVVTLTQGCDNKMTTCVNRFNNVQHFTGCRHIPVENPMDKG